MWFPLSYFECRWYFIFCCCSSVEIDFVRFRGRRFCQHTSFYFGRELIHHSGAEEGFDPGESFVGVTSGVGRQACLQGFISLSAFPNNSVLMAGFCSLGSYGFLHSCEGRHISHTLKGRLKNYFLTPLLLEMQFTSESYNSAPQLTG